MTLLDQLQHAEKGSREISDDVLKACGWKYDPGKDAREAGWVDPAGTFYDYWDDPHARSRNPIPHRPDPSQNLQDAVSLLPEGWWIDRLYQIPGTGWDCDLRANYPARLVRATTDADYRRDREPTKYPALALCIVIIKAHESKSAEKKPSKLPEIRRIAEADDGALEGDL